MQAIVGAAFAVSRREKGFGGRRWPEDAWQIEDPRTALDVTVAITVSIRAWIILVNTTRQHAPCVAPGEAIVGRMTVTIKRVSIKGVEPGQRDAVDAVRSQPPRRGAWE